MKSPLSNIDHQKLKIARAIHDFWIGLPSIHREKIDHESGDDAKSVRIVIIPGYARCLIVRNVLEFLDFRDPGLPSGGYHILYKKVNTQYERRFY